MSIVPIGGVGGPEWAVGGLEGTAKPAGTGFGKALADQLSSLEKTQIQAADASRSLADGTATDPTAAIVAVERAQLSMQLASQLRTKGIEAMQQIMTTQV
jgi:flagellar hook-basal body complex protein FliE